jgi:hypothetical protein
MQPTPLEGHYGPPVPTDVCLNCHLVWFDEFESVRLSGLGWVQLLRLMRTGDSSSGAPLSSRLGCVRCDAPLKPVNNLTRFGRFAALECPRRHGHLQTFSLLLAERGLVRPMSRSDLQTLAEEKRVACCLNCGSAISELAERCKHCESPLVVIDMPRLMEALLVRHAKPVSEEAASHVAWHCMGCGSALEPTRSARCEYCHHAVVVPSLVDIGPLLDTVEPILRGFLPRAAKPHGARLREQLGDYRATAVFRFWRRFSEPKRETVTLVKVMFAMITALAIWIYLH